MRLIRTLTYPYRYLTLRKRYPKDIARRKAKGGRGRPVRKSQ